MSLSDAELQGIAAQALNMAKRDLERGRFNFLLASYHTGDIPPLHRMSQVEALIVQRLGEDWLSHGRTKDAGFYVLRMATDALPPEALVFVTLMDGFRPTAKLAAMPPEEQLKIVDAGHNRHHEAVAEGLLTVEEILSAVAQTPERVCFYKQKLDNGRRFDGPPEADIVPQEEFDGRLKMFGTPEKNAFTTKTGRKA